MAAHLAVQLSGGEVADLSTTDVATTKEAQLATVFLVEAAAGKRIKAHRKAKKGLCRRCVFVFLLPNICVFGWQMVVDWTVIAVAKKIMLAPFAGKSMNFVIFGGRKVGEF